jgi:PilZ domain
VALQSIEASFETSIDSRYCRRHRLLLELEAKDSGTQSGTVTVYDISNTGLLIETNSSLSIGEMIEVQLPLVGFRTAEIIWTSGHLVGCKFADALTQGVVSAARLGGSFSRDMNKEQVEVLAVELEADDYNSDMSEEKLSLGTTLRVILGLAILAWAAVPVIVALIT